MSFVEKNKAWLLPLLGVGVLAVGYMNYRSITEAKPAAGTSSAGSPGNPQAPGPTAPAPPMAPTEGEETPASGDVWEDLRPMATVPSNLSQDGALRDKARLALQVDLLHETVQALGRPIRTGMAEPASKPVPAEIETPKPLGPPPVLDFLIHRTSGPQAWFEGQGYGIGESITGRGYSVRRIGGTFVELNGPAGRTFESTNPLNASGPEPPHPEEAP